MSITTLQQQLQDLVTTTDLTEIFEVSRMTIYRWRTHEGLNQYEVTIPGRDVRFSLKLVLRWAQKNEKKTPGLEAWRNKYRAA